MRRLCLVTSALLALLCFASFPFSGSGPEVDPGTLHPVIAVERASGSLMDASLLRFVENGGQWPDRIRFLARHGDTVAMLTRGSIEIEARPPGRETGLLLRLQFEGASEGVKLFSSERFHDALQPLVRALPLTQLNDALRAVILEGASPMTQTVPMLVLAAWGIVCFLLALRWFRWS